MISFSGIGQIQPDTLDIENWVNIEIDPAVHSYIDRWLREHPCTHPLGHRAFRASLGTMQVDHTLHIECLSCKKDHRAYGSDVDSGETTQLAMGPVLKAGER